MLMPTFPESILRQHLGLRFFNTRLVELKNRAAVQAHNMIVVIVRLLNAGFVKDNAGRIGEGFSKQPRLFEDVNGSINSRSPDGRMLSLNPPDHLLRRLVSPLRQNRLSNEIPLTTLIQGL